MVTGYYDLAKKIPAEFRKMILLENFIYKAVAREDDSDMVSLFVIYKNYIDPANEELQYRNGRIVSACRRCLTNILDKFKLLEPYLIVLEKEQNLLETA